MTIMRRLIRRLHPSSITRQWTEWLEDRPEFAKYIDYRVHKVPGRSDLDTSGMDADDIIGVLQEDRGVLSSIIVHMYTTMSVGTNHDRAYLQDLNDGEALAYATNMTRTAATRTTGDTDLGLMGGFIGGLPKRIGITLDEAMMMNDSILRKDRFVPQSYLRVLCASRTGLGPESPTNEEHQRTAYSIILNSVEAVRYDDPSSEWEDMDTFIDTACRYGHAPMLANVGRRGLTIGRDYLDHVLLATRPSPTDIPEEAWHGMVMRLVSVADGIGCGQAMVRKGLLFMTVREAMDRSLAQFLTRDQEELAFLETIHDFMDGDQQLDVRYVSGMLDPNVLDMLREYGPSFARPLFDMHLDRAMAAS